MEKKIQVHKQMADDFSRQIAAFVGNMAIQQKDVKWDSNAKLAGTLYYALCLGIARDWNCEDFLAWNNHTVPHLTEAVLKDITLMPILADALEDAGCHDESILEHLRSDTPKYHTNCAVVQKLIKGNHV